MKKKYIRATLPLLIILSISINIIDSSAVRIFPSPPPKITFSYGVMYLPFKIDPQDCWDTNSLEVIIQVMETLFTYNYSDPALPIIPLLAADFGTWDPSYTQYTIDLRTGVTFHDGSIFDADDVVFTFDRQAWLYNFTGLNTGYVPDVYELYVFPNGTPVIDNVVKVDGDTVTFKLNGVYGPFIDLLCYPASSILTDTYYDIGSGIVEFVGDIVGTGPFTYHHYEEDVEVVCPAYKNYWRGKAQIEELVFKQFIRSTERNAALLAGDIQFLKDPLPEMVDPFTADPDITVINTGNVSGGIGYLVMNNVEINRTWREAISYAFDYDYLINEIRYGNAVRMKSPVGVGIKYHNGSFPVPTTNLTKARLIMQSMGFGVGFNVSEDDEWIAKAASSSPFRAINYSYSLGNDIRERLIMMLIDNLAKIGIKTTDAGWSPICSPYDWWCSPPPKITELELFFTGWGPDYNDPINFINPLFTNKTVIFNLRQYKGYTYNVAQYNGYSEAIAAGRDPLALNDNVQLLMEAAIQTSNGPAREAMYDRIQELLVEDMPWCFCYTDKLMYAHHVNLTGFQQNFLNWVYFYPCRWEPGSQSGIEEEFLIVMIAILIAVGIISGIVIYIWLKRRTE